MKIGSIGSCLSNILVNRMMTRFGGEKIFHVYRNRSDQFYHYYIKKDKTIVPRKYIEDNLETSHEQPCQIFTVSFWDKALGEKEFSSCFDESLNFETKENNADC